MSDPLKAAVVAVILVAAFAAMRVGWGRRVGRASAVVPELPSVPSLGRPELGPVEATYLATAPADDRLVRIAAHGLAVRASAEVEVHGAGVLVRRRGAGDLFVPASDLTAVTRASGMAGTAVGADRVVVLRWRLGGVELDTGVLPRHPAQTQALADAVATLTGRRAADGPTGDAPATLKTQADAPTEGSHA